MTDKIQIYTDGSALGNPGPGGWAAVLLQDGKELKRLSGSFPETTNNRMEMQAVVEALKYACKYFPKSEFEIHSDSKLLISTLTEGWKRKKNLDLWEELDDLLQEINVQWHKVKGHANNKYNNLCDELARGAAASQPVTKPKLPEDDSVFFCPKCHKKGAGLFHYLPKAKLIRVDCEACGRFIKFAKQTAANLRRVDKL